MKPGALLDTSVVVSAIGWRGGPARATLRLLAARGFISYRTPAVTREWIDIMAEVSREDRHWSNPNWAAWLDWLKRASILRPDPPPKLISRRDLKDNPIVNAAIGCRADYLVTYDRHLLTLQKPYGVECVTPLAFLSAVLKS